MVEVIPDEWLFTIPPNGPLTRAVLRRSQPMPGCVVATQVVQRFRE